MQHSPLKNLNSKLMFLSPNHLPMKTLWCTNQENPSDRISHAWAPLNKFIFTRMYDIITILLVVLKYCRHTYRAYVKYRIQMFNCQVDYEYQVTHITLPLLCQLRKINRVVVLILFS
jgi:hypothetical protein